jgi:hypothetical protein
MEVKNIIMMISWVYRPRRSRWGKRVTKDFGDEDSSGMGLLATNLKDSCSTLPT